MWELAPAEVVELLDADATAEKRALWEAFEFTILEGGDVEVVNGSHEESSKHSYTVHVEGGIPAHCSCPAWEYQDGPCKHMVAIAIRKPLVEAVSAEPSMRADGGTTVEEAESDHSDERLDSCDCTPLMKDLPYWPCYRDDFEEPNSDAEVSGE